MQVDGSAGGQQRPAAPNSNPSQLHYTFLTFECPNQQCKVINGVYLTPGAAKWVFCGRCGNEQVVVHPRQWVPPPGVTIPPDHWGFVCQNSQCAQIEALPFNVVDEHFPTVKARCPDCQHISELKHPERPKELPPPSPVLAAPVAAAPAPLSLNSPARQQQQPQQQHHQQYQPPEQQQQQYQSAKQETQHQQAPSENQYQQQPAQPEPQHQQTGADGSAAAGEKRRLSTTDSPTLHQSNPQQQEEQGASKRTKRENGQDQDDGQVLAVQPSPTAQEHQDQMPELVAQPSQAKSDEQEQHSSGNGADAQ